MCCRQERERITISNHFASKEKLEIGMTSWSTPSKLLWTHACEEREGNRLLFIGKIQLKEVEA